MGANILVKRPLAANEAWAQPLQDRFHDTKPVGGVRGLIYADQAGTLYLEESDNEGSSWTTTSTVSVSAGVTAKLDWTALTKRWYRFRYVNGATTQTKFVLVQQSRGMDLADIQLTGSTLAKETNKAVTAATDILTDYTAPSNANSVLMVLTNTAGVLSLEVDAVLGSLNGGNPLDIGKWYAFEIPLTATSIYNLQFSVNATMQIKWIGGV